MIQNFSANSFIAGAIVGILVASIWFLGTNMNLTPMPTEQASSIASSTTSGAVAVSDQPAGSSVMIDSLTVPPPGVWIAVRDVNGSDLGNALGAVRIGAPRSNISVPLLRATEPNHQYAVELYRDDNNGAFDPTINSVYVDFGTGDPVVVYFKTTN
jgi:hypothetical protein